MPKKTGELAGLFDSFLNIIQSCYNSTIIADLDVEKVKSNSLDANIPRFATDASNERGHPKPSVKSVLDFIEEVGDAIV